MDKWKLITIWTARSDKSIARDFLLTSRSYKLTVWSWQIIWRLAAADKPIAGAFFNANLKAISTNQLASIDRLTIFISLLIDWQIVWPVQLSITGTGNLIKKIKSLPELSEPIKS